MSAASNRALAIGLAKKLGRFALTILLFWAAFSFLFHFGDVQALGLALAFAFSIDLALARKPPKQAAFTPHPVSLRFHIFPMLRDLQLITGDAEWKSLIGKAPHAGLWEANNVYYRAVSAFVIGTDPGLIHFPDRRFYAEQLKLDVTFGGLKILSTYRFWSPDVFIKPGRGGYHIGLRVNDNWWEVIRSTIEAGVVLHEDKESNFGTILLSLAVLPYEITNAYYQQTASGHQATIKELVAKTGWVNTELGGSEVGYFGESYDHTYANARVQRLDV